MPINFTGLEGTPRPSYVFRDFAFDLEDGNVPSRTNLFKSKQSTDVVASYDEGAVKNSLKNIFNTNPGEKLLNPEFGLSLKRYLFSPLTQDLAETIGDEIVSGIERYEPRVILNNVDVYVDFDDNQYLISLTLTIPPLNISQKRYNGIINQSGFSFL